MPDAIIKQSLFNLLRIQNGDANDKNNYRPIALITAASKLMELVLLNNMEVCIKSHHNQFGFKSKHVTDMFIYSLKILIQYYRPGVILSPRLFSLYIDDLRTLLNDTERNNYKIVNLLSSKDDTSSYNNI